MEHAVNRHSDFFIITVFLYVLFLKIAYLLDNIGIHLKGYFGDIFMQVKFFFWPFL